MADELTAAAADAAVETHPDWSRIPPHRHHLFLCEGKRCLARGARPVWQALCQALRAAGRMETVDGVLVTRTHCQYPCNLGPVATVYPQRVWYRVADAAVAERIVNEHLLAGRVVEDCRLPPPGAEGCMAEEQA